MSVVSDGEKDKDEKDCSHGVVRRFKVAFLSALLISCAIGTRTGFKISGYALGRKPFVMIFLTVLGSIPLNAIPYAYMVWKTGGVLPEFRTKSYFFDYWVVATLNVVNGLGIMWANPYVAGYSQSLLSSFAIPMTVMLSSLFLGSKFSIASIIGVALIVMGVLSSSLGKQPVTQAGPEFSVFWVIVYALAQVPLSGASVYQEYAFAGKSLNMFHYIHFVTIFLLVDLVPCVPVDLTNFGDSRSMPNLIDNTVEVLQCIAGNGTPECEGAGFAFILYVVCMNAGTVVQAVLIKNASAAWCMVVLSLATPLSAVAFVCPWIVGEAHVETLDFSVFAALLLVGTGTYVYRVGSMAPAKPKLEADEAPPGGYLPLEDGQDDFPSPPGTKFDKACQTEISGGLFLTIRQLLEAFPNAGSDSGPRPAVVSAGIGLFPSEYTNAMKNPVPIWAERTYMEGNMTPHISPHTSPRMKAANTPTRGRSLERLERLPS